MSSLNVFYSVDGERVLIATSNNDLPGPILGLQHCRYPKKRTGQYYEVQNCVHDFKHISFCQIRANDEAPSSIVRCTKCLMEKTL